MLDRLIEEMRLASFRAYLSSTVFSMSSLVPDLLGLVGMEVADAFQRIRPGHLWPDITAKEARYGGTGPSADRMVKGGRSLVKRPAPLIGDAVISDHALGHYVEAKVFGASLDVAIRGDTFELSTQDGTGYVRFASALPDTVVTMCMGRPLTEIVDHPVLRSHGYLVTDAAQVAGSSSLTFDVGRMPVLTPWRS